MNHFFQTIFTIWQRENIRYVREKSRVFSTFVQPLMFLAIFGSGLQSTLAASNFGIDFVKFMYPGIIGMSVMGVAFFSTISTVWDREFGFLKEILVAPVSRTAVAIGKTLGAATIASTQALLMLILAPFLGLYLHWSILLGFIATCLLLAFAISGLGLLIASLMRTTESFGLIMQLLFMPMFFLSGAFFPITNVPGWMLVLTRINPLTYGVDALRQIILSIDVPQEVVSRLVIHTLPTDLFFLIGFSVVMVGAAVVAFNKRA